MNYIYPELGYNNAKNPPPRPKTHRSVIHVVHEGFLHVGADFLFGALDEVGHALLDRVLHLRWPFAVQMQYFGQVAQVLGPLDGFAHKLKVTVHAVGVSL